MTAARFLSAADVADFANSCREYVYANAAGAFGDLAEHEACEEPGCALARGHEAWAFHEDRDGVWLGRRAADVTDDDPGADPAIAFDWRAPS